MGRGRAKAKQQKVARELKYNVHQTDFSALQRELGGGEQRASAESDEVDGEYDSDDDFDDADGWASAR